MKDTELEKLADEVTNLKTNTDISADVEAKVIELQDDIQKDLDIIRQKRKKRDFILRRLDEYRESYQSEDGGREKPLCQCPSPSCDLKDGRIPAAIDMASDIESGLAEFRQEHRGRPIGLDDALDEWYEKRRRVKTQLRTILYLLHHGEMPDSGDDVDDRSDWPEPEPTEA